MVRTNNAEVTYGSSPGRAVLAAAAIGSGMGFLDGSVVNVALKVMGEDLGAGLRDLQWVTNGYLLTLAAFILLGGSLGDRFGRRRIFRLGVVAFVVTSTVCAFAPTVGVLIAARVLQGIAAALMTPSSLAMIQGAFVRKDRAKVIGAWTALSGITTAVGPFLGGILVDQVSWRGIFLINLPLGLAALWFSRPAPETLDEQATGRFDIVGAVAAALALGSATYVCIEWGRAETVYLAVAAIAAGAVFMQVERIVKRPMVPLRMFNDAVFTAANVVTLLMYAALGALMFFLVLQLQGAAGYSATAAGVATVPVTIAMLALAARGGAFAEEYGPRIPMTVGPLVMALGALLLVGVDEHAVYFLDVFPGIALFGVGLSFVVAPLTATVLAAAADRQAGTASGINNAVARTGSLLSVAALPAAVGLSGQDYTRPAEFTSGYQLAMLIVAVLLVAGAALAWMWIPKGALNNKVTHQ